MRERAVGPDEGGRSAMRWRTLSVLILAVALGAVACGTGKTSGGGATGGKLILGPYGSASTEAASAVVERNGQVMADSSGADDKIFTKGYKRTFAVLSPATRYASSIVRAVAELAQPKPKTVAVLTADDGFSKTAAEGGIAEAKQQGLDVIAVEPFPAHATDVSAALTKVRAKNPDLIIGSVHLEEGIAIVKQSRELGVTPSGGFGETVAPPTPDFRKALGKQAE